MSNTKAKQSPPVSTSYNHQELGLRDEFGIEDIVSALNAAFKAAGACVGSAEMHKAQAYVCYVLPVMMHYSAYGTMTDEAWHKIRACFMARFE